MMAFQLELADRFNPSRRSEVLLLSELRMLPIRLRFGHLGESCNIRSECTSVLAGIDRSFILRPTKTQHLADGLLSSECIWKRPVLLELIANSPAVCLYPNAVAGFGEIPTDAVCTALNNAERLLATSRRRTFGS